MLRSLGFLILTLMLNACSSTSNKLYYWGNYEALLYEHFNDAGQIDVDAHVRALELIVDRANKKQHLVAPGIYAHLGYMYSLQGELLLSEKALLEEKRRFPESSSYIERLIENIKIMDQKNYAEH